MEGRAYSGLDHGLDRHGSRVMVSETLAILSFLESLVFKIMIILCICGRVSALSRISTTRDLSYPAFRIKRSRCGVCKATDSSLSYKTNLVPAFPCSTSLHGVFHFRIRRRHHRHLSDCANYGGGVERSRGSQADYQAVERGLTNLSQVLINIDRLAESKKQVINTASLEQTLRDCYRCLLDFNAKIEKYSRALGAHGQKHSLKDVFRKIVWMNEKEDGATFHQAVCMNLAILQILLQLTSE